MNEKSAKKRKKSGNERCHFWFGDLSDGKERKPAAFWGLDEHNSRFKTISKTYFCRIFYLNNSQMSKT